MKKYYEDMIEDLDNDLFYMGFENDRLKEERRKRRQRKIEDRKNKNKKTSH